MDKDIILEELQKERDDCKKVFEDIYTGSMSFEDFYYGWLDNLKNMEFEAGVYFERSECIENIRTIGGKFAEDCEQLILTRADENTL